MRSHTVTATTHFNEQVSQDFANLGMVSQTKSLRSASSRVSSRLSEATQGQQRPRTSPLGRSKILSLPECSVTSSPRWDKFLNLVLDGRDRTPQQTRHDILRRRNNRSSFCSWMSNIHERRRDSNGTRSLTRF